MIPGVYEIRNEANGKRYVGSSCVCLFRRLSFHLRDLREGRHKNLHLQAAWNKYGEASFTCRALEVVFSGRSNLGPYLERREQLHIDATPAAFRYNLCLVAGSRFGSSMPSSARAKIGKAFRGKVLSQAHKAKLRDANLGQGKGRRLSLETCAKMSASRKGLRLSKEAKEKLSASRKGVVFSATHKKNLSLGQKRRHGDTV